MKIFFLILFCQSAFAVRAQKIEGTLVSYSDTHVKIKSDTGIHRVPLKFLSSKRQAEIHKLIGKKINAYVPLEEK